VSHFEFISIAVSIIFAMTLGRLVASLPEITRRPNRDYLQIAFVIAFIAHQILLWWRLWQLNSIEKWNFLEYFLIITAPLANYLTAIALVGTHGAPEDSEEFFSRKWFFYALTATWTISAINTWYLLDIKPYFIAGMTLVAAAGALFDKRWIHLVVLGLMVAAFVLTAALEFTL